jgi:hypothetical protein
MISLISSSLFPGVCGQIARGGWTFGLGAGSFFFCGMYLAALYYDVSGSLELFIKYERHGKTPISSGLIRGLAVTQRQTLLKL